MVQHEHFPGMHRLYSWPLQDIAVVPFLVLLPLIENGDLMEPGQSTMSLLAALGPTALQARACPSHNAWSCLQGWGECIAWQSLA